MPRMINYLNEIRKLEKLLTGIGHASRAAQIQ